MEAKLAQKKIHLCQHFELNFSFYRHKLIIIQQILFFWANIDPLQLIY